MCCLALLAFGIGPRVAFVFWWIFGDKVDAAFSTWVWPLLGLLFLPWTSLFYVAAWGALHGVSGWGWVLVGIGVFLDVATYSGRFARDRYQTAT
jgi:hypothetical protein